MPTPSLSVRLNSRLRRQFVAQAAPEVLDDAVVTSATCRRGRWALRPSSRLESPSECASIPTSPPSGRPASCARDCRACPRRGDGRTRLPRPRCPSCSPRCQARYSIAQPLEQARELTPPTIERSHMDVYLCLKRVGTSIPMLAGNPFLAVIKMRQCIARWRDSMLEGFIRERWRMSSAEAANARVDFDHFERDINC